MNEKSVRRLCSAVILRAIGDLSEAAMYIQAHTVDDDPLEYRNTLRRYNELRQFFLSDWFEQMNPTPVSGTRMIARIATAPQSFQSQTRGVGYGIQ